LTADEKGFELYSGDRVVNSLRWDHNRGDYGSYVDARGVALGRRFDEAKAAVEKAAEGRKR